MFFFFGCVSFQEAILCWFSELLFCKLWNWSLVIKNEVSKMNLFCSWIFFSICNSLFEADDIFFFNICRYNVEKAVQYLMGDLRNKLLFCWVHNLQQQLLHLRFHILFCHFYWFLLFVLALILTGPIKLHSYKLQYYR